MLSAVASVHLSQPPNVNPKCHQATLYLLRHLGLPKKGQPVPSHISLTWVLAWKITVAADSTVSVNQGKHRSQVYTGCQ